MARSHNQTADLSFLWLFSVAGASGTVFCWARGVSVVLLLLLDLAAAAFTALVEMSLSRHSSPHSRPFTASRTLVNARSFPARHIPNAAECLQTLDQERFERLVTLLYQQKGYEVKRLGGSLNFVLGPGGLDLAVQCKYWKHWLVGAKEIREFIQALTAAGFAHGRFVALGDFSADARDLASKHNIQLITGTDVVRMMDEVNWSGNDPIRFLLNEV